MDSYNCQWSNPEECGKNRLMLKYNKYNITRSMCTFLGMYCTLNNIPHFEFSSTINPVTFIDSHTLNILDGKLLFKDHKVTRDELLSWKP